MPPASPFSDATSSAASAAGSAVAGVRSAKQAILRLVGEIDVTAQLHYRTQADELLLDDEVTGLVVDLSGTTMLDSSALGFLVHLKMLARANAISLVLRAAPPRICTLLRLTQLDRIFDMEADDSSRKPPSAQPE